MGEAQISSFSSYGLRWCFKQLGKEELQTFKALLKESASEPATCSFPLAQVDAADSALLASLLQEHYKESSAWKLSIDIFEKMSLSALSEMARDEMRKYLLAEVPEDSIPTKMDQGPSVEEAPGHRDDQQDYKSHVMTKFSLKPDAHQSFEKFASDCPDVHMLLGAFHPDQGGFRPLTVVLHGKAGIGKSALARRILQFWAQGELYQSMFSYVFFLHAREIQWMRECSFAELISREWPDAQVPVEEILSQPERLLFVVDGIEDLDLAFKDDDSNLSGDWTEKQPVSLVMHSLLKKALLPECSLIITVGDADIEKLQSVLLSPRYLLVGGLSVEKRMQLLLEHVKDEHQKIQTLHSVVGNHEVFDKCQVSVVCSLVREALKLQEAPGKSFPIAGQTLTNLYTSFVFHQLAPKDAVQRPLSQEERVALKGLCRMAVDGVWNSKFVFYSDDLGVHGLKEPKLPALFHAGILLRGSRCEKCYTFLHLSLQEFCAALYYVLEGLEGGGDPYPPFTENRKSLTELKQVDFNVHLVQMKRFLFGLMSKEAMGALETLLGCPVPLAAKQGLLRWISLLGQHANTTAPQDFLDAFYCLFETQDDEFVRSALNRFQAVRLPMNRPMDLTVSSFCLQRCQYLRKIRLDVREVPKDEFAEAWPRIPQGLQIKTRDERWENLCSALSTHPNLRELDLSDSILSEEAMKTLCIHLRQPTCKIQNLIFKGAHITRGLRHLWVTLINRNIKYLDLESTHLKDGDVMMACEALKHPNCLLESLRLDHCGLTHTCCQVISQMLVTSVSLKSLSLAGNKVTDQSIKSLCDALKVTRCTLQKLILGNCGLTASDCQDLASALAKNQSLTHLYLSGNSLGSEGMNLLCRAVKLPSCGLQRLILNACNLDVAGCGFLAFALMGNRRLTHLSLSLNPLEDDGMNLLCEVLMELSCPLQDLELAKCNLTAACCKNLSYVIIRSHHLKSLDLAANALGDNGITALCEGLKQKNSLRRLGLEACGLTCNGGEALSSALSCNQQLTSLNLMQNSFGLRGMTKLCSAFAHPTSNLQTIGLWKWQYPTRIRRLLEELQRLKPQIVIGDRWYCFAEDDRCWWKN
ncbi:NACHT, LRR and PYD domains-containing protein 5 [Hippopotamus amphibius kiboko]|uniref:NACHT, LRR and PYD domains-containing protein 5 n=1 Tax=Hippopotamus amphibius kiboko TaxID=575201 RepID=UPI00259324CB|nr:NACHT, LRR and PYD domains-containing protein 5 [Hippopotamus amphibius kiboko]